MKTLLLFNQDKAEARTVSKKESQREENVTRFPRWLWPCSPHIAAE
jgi:hypothetical protein